jgi:hypothetical protein
MIICGYQGIGKSTIAGQLYTIDLESSNFYIDGERDENWYKAYANIAHHLSEQGYIVFTASHKLFREYMNLHGIEFVTVSPALELKDEWVEKLNQRYLADRSEKNYRAYINAKISYEDNVRDLQSEKNAYIINSMDYLMYDVIREVGEKF